MDVISVLEINYNNYGRCLKVTNSVVEVIVTLDYGPRIIKYGYSDGINHFAEGIDSKISTSHGEYFIIGGHRFCHLPENEDRTYIPDNYPVEYEKIENGIRFIQEIEKWTQVQKIIEITFEYASTKVSVSHRLVSLNAFDINVGVCGITAVERGGIEIIPLSKKSDGTAPNRAIVFWPYSNMKDSRVYYGDKYVAMKVCENVSSNFKIGMNSNLSYALYFNKNELFVKEFKRNKNENNYPNMGCSYESFIGNDYLEMQTNSPICSLKTNESIEHIEIWNLYKDVNLDFIDTFIDNYNEINSLVN